LKNKKVDVFCGTQCTWVYYVLQSQKIAAGYANNEIHQEIVEIDVSAAIDIQYNE